MPDLRRRHVLPLPLCLLLGLCVPCAAAVTPESQGEWPCVQRKVETLTSAQLWDGGEVDALTGWGDDPEIARILPVLTSRRVPVEDAAAAVRRFAESQPEAARDARLKLLFAAVLKTVNDDRAQVMRGIERFQNRQRARAAELERQGLEIKALKERAAMDPAAREPLARAEERYAWDARIFAERQQSMPIACEIPVLIEQRVFDLGREIRSHMKE